jgi:hypothetical protein
MKVETLCVLLGKIFEAPPADFKRIIVRECEQVIKINRPLFDAVRKTLNHRERLNGERFQWLAAKHGLTPVFTFRG